MLQSKWSGLSALRLSAKGLQRGAHARDSTHARRGSPSSWASWGGRRRLATAAQSYTRALERWPPTHLGGYHSDGLIGLLPSSRTELRPVRLSTGALYAPATDRRLNRLARAEAGAAGSSGPSRSSSHLNIIRASARLATTDLLTSDEPPNLSTMTTPSGKLIGPRQRKIALLGSRSVGQYSSTATIRVAQAGIKPPREARIGHQV